MKRTTIALVVMALTLMASAGAFAYDEGGIGDKPASQSEKKHEGHKTSHHGHKHHKKHHAHHKTQEQN